MTCLCRYSDDIRGQMWFGKAALGARNGLRLRLYGSEGSAEWLQTDPEVLVLSRADGRREILDRGGLTEVAGAARYERFKAGHPAGFIEAFANLYSDIADALDRHGATGERSGDEVFGADLAAEGLRFLEAMHRSAQRHAWVEVPRGTEAMER